MFRITRASGAAARWLIIALLVAALTGCASQVVSPSIEVATSPTESPSPELDVASAFADVMGSPALSIEADITGSVEVGAVEGAVTGSLAAGDGGTHILLQVALPGQAVQTTETLTVGGKTYQREGDLWFLSTDETAADNSFAAALGDLESLEDEGIVERDGERLHRLVPTQPLDLDAASLGFTDPSVSGFEGGVEFFATEAGAPAGLIITATWQQEVNGQPLDGVMTLNYAFTSVGEMIDLAPPDEVWVKFTSDAFGYQMAYPSTWDFQHIPADGEFAAYDAFLAPATTDPVLTEVDVYHYPDLEAGWLPNAWFFESGALLEELWGTAPETSEPIEVNGIEAQLFTLHGAQDDGTETYFQEAAIFAGDVAWDVDWYASPGNEAHDRELFLKMLSTFRPTGTPVAAPPDGGNVWGLKPGQCFSPLPPLPSLIESPAGQSGLFVGGVDGFSQVDCSEPHGGEVIAVLSDVATAECEVLFAEYVGRPLEGSELGSFTFMTTSLDNPPEGVDGLCVVADAAGAPGSAEGSGR